MKKITFHTISVINLTTRANTWREVIDLNIMCYTLFEYGILVSAKISSHAFSKKIEIHTFLLFDALIKKMEFAWSLFVKKKKIGDRKMRENLRKI